jgi:hypothetical protein
VPREPAPDPRQGFPDNERIKADLDGVARAITLCCPRCDELFEWTTPLAVSELCGSPTCERCSAPFPMECHDCGIDLSVDGFGARVLKDQNEKSGHQPVWGLYCPPCLDVYDRFSIPQFELKPCAQCGKMVAAGELHIRQINEKLGAGALAWHQATMAGVCSDCAKSVDLRPRSFVSSMAVLLALVALFAVACFFLG